MSVEQSLSQRDCPLCGARVNSGSNSLWRSGRLPVEGWESLSFSSRKARESFHWEYHRCAVCDLIYAPWVPRVDLVKKQVETAPFSMSSGHRDAAQDYADFLMALNEGQTPTDVLDLGAGDGSFLAELQRRGAQSLSGIEASLAAMERAPPQIRSIIEPIFLDPRSASFQEWVGRHSSSAGYLTCFQLIEHLHEPLEVLRAARGTLRPGGYLLIVSHDVSGWVQRLFRSRSPLLDVEHFQLFSKKTLADLLRRAGFESVQVSSFSNRHSVAHWLQLSPLPSPLRQRLAKVLIRARLADYRLRAPAVNVVGLARF